MLGSSARLSWRRTDSRCLPRILLLRVRSRESELVATVSESRAVAAQLESEVASARRAIEDKERRMLDLEKQIAVMKRQISIGKDQLLATKDMREATALMTDLAPKEVMLRELEAQVGGGGAGHGGEGMAAEKQQGWLLHLCSALLFAGAA
jgi:hypothetical protein